MYKAKENKIIENTQLITAILHKGQLIGGFVEVLTNSMINMIMITIVMVVTISILKVIFIKAL